MRQEFKFKTEPYEHQKVAFDKLKDLPYSALFADMGTGKTKMSLDIAAYKYAKGEIDGILIIAPNNVHSQWVIEQLPLHLSVPYKAIIWSSQKKDGNLFQNALEGLLTPKLDVMKVLSVNVEAFQSTAIEKTVAIYVKHNNILTIVDEATRIKTPTAKRSKTIHKINKYGERMILTGTPVTKSPFGLWSMFEFLKPNFFGVNFFIFQRRYGIMMRGVNAKTGRSYNTVIDEKTWNIVKNGIRKMKESKLAELRMENMDLPDDTLIELTDDDYLTLAACYSVSEKNIKFIETREDFVKYKRLDELKQQIDSITFSVKKEDCLDLPPKVYEQIFVDMNDEQEKVYNNLRVKLLAEYEGKELSVQNKVALTTRLMQICGGFFPTKEVYDRDEKQYVPFVDDDQLIVPDGFKALLRTRGELIGKTNVKLEALKADFEEARTPIILWAQFVAEIDYLYDELKKDYKCCRYYGATPQREREQILAEFKMGGYEVFIGNPSTAAYGLNLQNATLQYYFSNSFRVEDRLQAEDRSHRIGVKASCVYKDVICRNTIDEKIARAIITGRDMNDFFKASSLRDLLT